MVKEVVGCIAQGHVKPLIPNQPQSVKLGLSPHLDVVEAHAMAGGSETYLGVI